MRPGRETGVASPAQMRLPYSLGCDAVKQRYVSAAPRLGPNPHEWPQTGPQKSDDCAIGAAVSGLLLRGETAAATAEDRDPPRPSGAQPRDRSARTWYVNGIGYLPSLRVGAD